jgi:single-strand DNA-binding protein
MSDTLTLTGVVGTIPRHIVTSEGLAITSFRLASTHRRFDRAQEKWVDGETNWYTITAFRQLALNSAACVSKGDRVVVTGKLHIRDWKTDDKAGTTVEIDAEAVGHDLLWGTTTFTRSVTSTLGERPLVTGDAEVDETPTSANATQLDELAPAPTAEDALAAPF